MSKYEFSKDKLYIFPVSDDEIHFRGSINKIIETRAEELIFQIERIMQVTIKWNDIEGWSNNIFQYNKEIPFEIVTDENTYPFLDRSDRAIIIEKPVSYIESNDYQTFYARTFEFNLSDINHYIKMSDEKRKILKDNSNEKSLQVESQVSLNCHILVTDIRYDANKCLTKRQAKEFVENLKQKYQDYTYTISNYTENKYLIAEAVARMEQQIYQKYWLMFSSQLDKS